MATRVRSYSKINLGLAIGPVRVDGFHGLATLYQTLALHDLVTVEARRVAAGGQSKITLTTNHPRVPTDARNTAWRMVERALARVEVAAEVVIHIEKELPVQGGLGAGSANAAAALIGLERELDFALPETERLEIAAEVGSDVPLFLIGGAVLGMGRGEQVSAMPDLPATVCVIALPDVGVSTPRAFQEWDGLCAAKAKASASASAKYGGPSTSPSTRCAPSGSGRDDDAEGLRSGRDGGVEETGEGLRLTPDAEPDRLKELSHVYASVFGVRPLAEQASDTSGIVRGPEFQGSTLNGLAGNTLLALVRTGIENDFEQVVFPQYPLLREIKRLLMGTSADGFSNAHPADSSGNAFYAALSGSGSALFGLYGSTADAKSAQQRVQASGCKAILTETLPRQEYWRRMFAE
jgi:4-diphosphocytidyl-2-C-methyl-D-erythritol kinase